MDTTVNLFTCHSADTNGILREIRRALDRGIRPAAILTVHGMANVAYTPDDTYAEISAEMPPNCEIKLTNGEVGRLHSIRFPLNNG